MMLPFFALACSECIRVVFATYNNTIICRRFSKKKSKFEDFSEKRLFYYVLLVWSR